ncbi:hypothetical protein ACQJBY_037274 [Aegilops geniculata]
MPSPPPPPPRPLLERAASHRAMAAPSLACAYTPPCSSPRSAHGASTTSSSAGPNPTASSSPAPVLTAPWPPPCLHVSLLTAPWQPPSLARAAACYPASISADRPLLQPLCSAQCSNGPHCLIFIAITAKKNASPKTETKRETKQKTLLLQPMPRLPSSSS